MQEQHEKYQFKEGEEASLLADFKEMDIAPEGFFPTFKEGYRLAMSRIQQLQGKRTIGKEEFKSWLNKKDYGGPSAGMYRKGALDAYAMLTESKPSPVIEIGEQKGEIPQDFRVWINETMPRKELSERTPEIVANQMGYVNGAQSAYRKLTEKRADICSNEYFKEAADNAYFAISTVTDARTSDAYMEGFLAGKESTLTDPPASHPAPAPIVGERDKKTECTCLYGPTDANPICAWPNCFKPEEKAGHSVAPKEQALPEEARASLNQRFSRNFFLKVAVTSDLLPENEQTLRAQISTALESAVYAVIGRLRNTGIMVEEVPDIEKQIDQEIGKIEARVKDFNPTYKNHFNDGAEWAFKKIKALITK